MRKSILTVLLLLSMILLLAPQVYATSLLYDARPLYTTTGDPADYIVPPGGTLDGVGDLIVTRSDGTFRGTAALLPTGRHILTAAHMVTNDSGVFNTASANITFEGDSGDVADERNGAPGQLEPQAIEVNQPTGEDEQRESYGHQQ